MAKKAPPVFQPTKFDLQDLDLLVEAARDAERALLDFNACGTPRDRKALERAERNLDYLLESLKQRIWKDCIY